RHPEERSPAAGGPRATRAARHRGAGGGPDQGAVSSPGQREHLRVAALAPRLDPAPAAQGERVRALAGAATGAGGERAERGGGVEGPTPEGQTLAEGLNMRIVTPSEVATQTQNKYLGVLVAAKFAKFVNEFPRDRSVDLEQKLTTRALDELVRARLKYRLVRRRRQEG